MTRVIPFILVLYLTQSCKPIALLLKSNKTKLGTVYLPGNQNIDSIYLVNDGTYAVRKTLPANGAIAKIAQQEQVICLDLINLKDTLKVEKRHSIGEENLGCLNSYRFPASDSGRMPFKAKWWERTLVAQALTIPIKMRLPTKDLAYSVESSINLSFGFGVQFTHNSFQNNYNGNGKYLNSVTRKCSLTTAFFVGPSIVSLSQKNTSPSISNERNVLGTTEGAVVVFGIGRVNLGAALGLENLYGPKESDEQKWIYNNKPWIGLVLALDFLKN
ncbi:MAG: hypothetical protein JST46_17715 [Bacteroidetes bacterium]|nr:hypothetical protein [Bacteroidota bacterium]